MDVCKAQFLQKDQLHVLVNNADIIQSKNEPLQPQELPSEQDSLAAAKKEVCI
jgi:hypothetical protein